MVTAEPPELEEPEELDELESLLPPPPPQATSSVAKMIGNSRATLFGFLSITLYPPLAESVARPVDQNKLTASVKYRTRGLVQPGLYSYLRRTQIVGILRGKRERQEPFCTIDPGSTKWI